MAKDRQGNIYTACHLKPDDRAKIDKMAVEQDRTVGYIMRQLVLAQLQEIEKTAKAVNLERA